MLQDEFTFLCSVKINSGNRALEHLPFELAALGAGKPLLLTNGARRRKILQNAFKNSGLTICIYDKISREPKPGDILKLSELYRSNRCDALIVAGSGREVDAAKAVNLLVSHDWDRLERAASEEAISGPLKPFVVIPTISCDGSEATGRAEAGGTTFESPFLMPDLAVLDTRMMWKSDLPHQPDPFLAALTHSAEACTGSMKNPATEVYAAAAVQLLSENLLHVANNPSDRKGLLRLANAAIMSGCAFSNTSPGMAHHLGRATGELHDIPQGICMGLLLPYTLQYQIVKKEGGLSDLLLPMAGPEVFARTAEDLRAPVAVNMIYALLYDLNKIWKGGLPLTLKETGLEKGALESIAQRAMENAPELFELNELSTVLFHAWDGHPMVLL